VHAQCTIPPISSDEISKPRRPRDCVRRIGQYSGARLLKKRSSSKVSDNTSDEHLGPCGRVFLRPIPRFCAHQLQSSISIHFQLPRIDSAVYTRPDIDGNWRTADSRVPVTSGQIDRVGKS